MPFIDREVQNELEKKDISRLKSLYRSLQVGKPKKKLVKSK